MSLIKGNENDGKTYISNDEDISYFSDTFDDKVTKVVFPNAKKIYLSSSDNNITEIEAPQTEYLRCGGSRFVNLVLQKVKLIALDASVDSLKTLFAPEIIGLPVYRNRGQQIRIYSGSNRRIFDDVLNLDYSPYGGSSSRVWREEAPGVYSPPFR